MIKFFRNIRQNLLSEGKTEKYFKYAIGEIVLVVIGILIALSINNWNQERINKNNTKGMLDLIHRELIEDIKSLENEIENRTEKHHLISRAMDIIEHEANSSAYHLKVLDSAFLRYNWIGPLFNNTRSYEAFLTHESNSIDKDIYKALNKYLDIYNETNARIERFSDKMNQMEYTISMATSIKRINNAEYEYDFYAIKNEKKLYEILRFSKNSFNIVSLHYSKVLEKAEILETAIQNFKSR